MRRYVSWFLLACVLLALGSVGAETDLPVAQREARLTALLPVAPEASRVSEEARVVLSEAAEPPGYGFEFLYRGQRWSGAVDVQGTILALRPAGGDLALPLTPTPQPITSLTAAAEAGRVWLRRQGIDLQTLELTKVERLDSGPYCVQWMPRLAEGLLAQRYVSVVLEPSNGGLLVFHHTPTVNRPEDLAPALLDAAQAGQRAAEAVARGNMTFVVEGTPHVLAVREVLTQQPPFAAAGSTVRVWSVLLRIKATRRHRIRPVAASTHSLVVDVDDVSGDICWQGPEVGVREQMIYGVVLGPSPR